jgi:hypothetical protein
MIRAQFLGRHRNHLEIHISISWSLYRINIPMGQRMPEYSYASRTFFLPFFLDFWVYLVTSALQQLC